jgi:hypothetical protein
MARKSTEHEKILRVHEIYRLLIKGASRYRILRHASEKWKVSERTGETYLAEARQLLSRDLEIERPKWLEQSIAEIQDWKDLNRLEQKANQFKPKLDAMQEEITQLIVK